MHVDERGNTLLRTMSVEEDDQITDGWLCDRGRYNIGYVSDERRITQPLYKENGAWSQIGWDDAIAMWANALRSTLAANGPQSAGVIGGGRLLNEEAFLLRHVHRAVGIENIDWRAGRQLRAHPGDFGGTHVDLENANVIVTYGRPPAQLAPVLDLRIRKAVSRNGATLISIGDHGASDVVREARMRTVADAQQMLPSGAERIAFVWDGTEAVEADAFLAWAGSRTRAARSRSDCCRRPAASTRAACSKRPATASWAHWRFSVPTRCCAIRIARSWRRHSKPFRFWWSASCS
jgi:NADH dehydrogenase/NADH:ubiquinone oxidoreductase subunit G